MKKKLLLLIIGIIIATIITAMTFSNKNKNTDYTITTIEQKDLLQTVDASGTINPVQSVNIGSQVSGRIYKLYADFNSKVKKGQLLAEIDPALFQAQVDKANADVYNASSNYQKTKAKVTYNQANYNRYARLYKKHYVSKDEVENSYATYTSSLSELSAMQALINLAKASLTTASTNLYYTKIISPVDGVVVSRKVDVGQTVTAGFQTPELFVVAQDLTQMQIEVNVSEADIGKIKEGQKAEYSLDGYPDETFEGVVSQIRIAPTTVSNVTTYTVIVKVNNDNNILKPGMNANVTIITQNKKNAYCVLNSAFKYIPQNSKTRYQETGIWTLKDNKPYRINVKKGLSDFDYTEIEGENITKGMPVLTPKANDKTKSQAHPPMRMP